MRLTVSRILDISSYLQPRILLCCRPKPVTEVPNECSIPIKADIWAFNNILSFHESRKIKGNC